MGVVGGRELLHLEILIFHTEHIIYLIEPLPEKIEPFNTEEKNPGYGNVYMYIYLYIYHYADIDVRMSFCVGTK